MHSACARRAREDVPLGRHADSMFVISWQGGMTGEVTFGRQTEFTVVCVQSVRDEMRVRRERMGGNGGEGCTVCFFSIRTLSCREECGLVDIDRVGGSPQCQYSSRHSK
jgi:hypothetical protein